MFSPIPAGLPNITGNSGTLRGADDSQIADWSGAMWRQWYNQGAQSGYHGACSNIFFDASRCSTIYGSSTTVTPLSYKTSWLIRF